MFPGFVRDAGMFASSGASLPPGVGTVTPEAVAAGIVRRWSATGRRSTSPRSGCGWARGWRAWRRASAASVQRKLGGDKVARSIADGQRERR